MLACCVSSGESYIADVIDATCSLLVLLFSSRQHQVQMPTSGTFSAWCLQLFHAGCCSDLSEPSGSSAGEDLRDEIDDDDDDEDEDMIDLSVDDAPPETTGKSTGCQPICHLTNTCQPCHITHVSHVVQHGTCNSQQL